MQLMYRPSFTAAEHSIDSSNACFVPDDVISQALLRAAKRGVKIRIIMLGKIIDTETVRAASRSRWGPLLPAGAEI